MASVDLTTLSCAALARARLASLDADEHWFARRLADETAAALREWLEAVEG